MNLSDDDLWINENHQNHALYDNICVRQKSHSFDKQNP